MDKYFLLKLIGVFGGILSIYEFALEPVYLLDLMIMFLISLTIIVIAEEMKEKKQEKTQSIQLKILPENISLS
jgi:hypothetical protein